MAPSRLRTAVAALEGLDARALAACYADEFLFEDVPGSRRISDREELLEYFGRLFAMPGCRFDNVAVFDSDEWASIEWTWSGRKRVAEGVFTVRGASVLELREGKIRREAIYYDPRPTLE